MARVVTQRGNHLPPNGMSAVIASPRSAEGWRSALAIERLILWFTLRRDLGFRWLAQRSVADNP